MSLSGETSKPFSSDLLCDIAPLASEEIISYVKDKSARCYTRKLKLLALGSRIGTALYLIAGHLEMIQPFQLSATAQDLSHRALQDLLEISTWSTKSVIIKDCNELPGYMPSPSSRIICDKLKIRFSLGAAAIKTGIRNFLSGKQSDVEYYADRFQELLDLLDPDNRKLDSAGHKSLYGKHMQPHEEDIYPDEIRENLITTLGEHARCVWSMHKSQRPVQQSICHPTRLGLRTEGRNMRQLVEFDLAVAPIDFEFWHYFSLSVALDPAGKGLRKISPDSMNPDGSEDDEAHSMKAGDVCSILESQRNYNFCVKHHLKLDYNWNLHKHRRPIATPYLKSRGRGLSLAELLDSDQYELNPQNKIMLSFAIARSFWEFYGSELTMKRWCSKDIWFMPRQKRSQTNSDHLELKAFVSFPFEQKPQKLGEFLDMDDLTHSYPQILSLGIILLEIGRGENMGLLLPTANESLEELRDSVNDAHSDAISQLPELSNEVWETCKYKQPFDTAIANCLDPTKFIESPSTRRRRSRLSPEEYDKLPMHQKAEDDKKRRDYQRRAIQDRREAIYRNVVSPLYWLAKVGNIEGKDHMFIKLRRQQHEKLQRRPNFPGDLDKEEIQELWRRVQTPDFNSDSDRQAGRSAERWFEDIRAISNLIFTRRRLLDVRKKIKLPPVRIAVLDTGCNLALKSFQAAKCFKAWGDFAGEPSSKTEVDKVGHGTFMARLVMQMVPGCELYIARIAQTRQQLESNEGGVAQAIRHASKEWEVDVISMSFGFPKFSQVISDAICDVKKSRHGAIIFLASAGNDVNRAEAYPACDPSVISMYATKSTGAFVETNPIPSEESQGLKSLGTYGDSVPDAVLGELRAQFPLWDFSAGTSVATAVAAGIVGMMLAYAALMPHALPNCGAEDISRELKTTEGMRCMLLGMANSWNSQYFINPIRFWSSNPNDLEIYRSIIKALPHI